MSDGTGSEFFTPSKVADLLQDGGQLDSGQVFAAFSSLTASVNVMFVCISGYLVFFMQAGFAVLTAGSVRSKNTKNVLLKNVLDACVGAIAYFIFGYAFAYGAEGNAFISYGNFALADSGGVPFQALESFFFQWTFAATAATIVSGSVAERTSFYAYLGYAFFLTSFVYPVVSHWIWDPRGWLYDIYGAGVIDFAGCIVVHAVGGFAGLAGAVIVGPRLGRFDSDGNVVPIPGHSAALCTMGTFILWFGWYGFNPGSALAIAGSSRLTVARCVVNTTVAAGSAGVSTVILIKIRDGIYDLPTSLNGLLTGLVSITSCCAFVDPWAAMVIGIIGSAVYIGATSLLLRAKIDDPLEAWPIHGAGGTWGALAGCFFNRKIHQSAAQVATTHWGLFYGGGGKLLASNLTGLVATVLWTWLMVVPMFSLMKLFGILRISAEEEIIGNDVSKHGGNAYPMDADAAMAAANAVSAMGSEGKASEDFDGF